MARKRKRRKWLYLGLVLLVGFVIWSALPRPKPQSVRVAGAWRMPELKAVVNGSGEIQTEDSVDIQAEIAGVIIELPVREGDHVEKDQILLKIDPFQTLTDVDSAQASLSALEAERKGKVSQVASAEANAARDQFLKKSAEVGLLQAEANLARTLALHRREEKLLQDKLISDDQFEVSETQLKVDEAQVDAATAKINELDAQIKAAAANVEFSEASVEALEKRIDGAKSNLQRVEDLLKKTTIRSPLSGVIVKLNVEVGERAVPGIQSNPIATLMTIADLRVIEAELQIDETDIVNVNQADVGEVVVDALPDEPLVGRVVEIGNSPITNSGSTQEGKDFKVVLRIENPPESLRPGMSCEADITTAVRKNVLVLPIQALTMREVEVDDEGKYVPPVAPPKQGGLAAVVPKTASAAPASESKLGPEAKPESTDDASTGTPMEPQVDDKKYEELQGVFVVGADSFAHFRPIKTGILGEMEVEVLEGIEMGEEVVVGPLTALRTLMEYTPVVIDRTQPFRRFGKRGFDKKESGDNR